ncbi:anthranilate N-methyltransferase [Cajanus cajan]|uniref:caffeate O-methyltransferase n=1 Tax=Cajanus cajan TaxID=3821 RepID=A0A151TY80_CAJCA|nr:anthranilate N-methyltransferase [Cajanus cajan]KYP72006.1 Caffeic acid 3-O-methyltransferase [Cajanus cajan]
MAPPIESNTKHANGRREYEEEDDELAFCMEKMVAFVVPMALRTSFELGIFDILGKAGEGAKLSAKEIALEIGSNNPQAPAMLDRLLCLLVSHSLLSCSVSQQPPHQRLFSLARGSKYLVTDPHGVSLGSSLTLLLDEVFYKSWSELKGSILEGGVAFDRAHGMHAFEYPSVDPRFNDVFNKGMTGITTQIMKRILELYKGFEHVTKLVDVGGGLGVNLKLITSKYPHIQAINFDLPHVVQHAPDYAGVEFVGGDMFLSVPSGDAIFMKWILHDWSDEHCLKLLKNCYSAIPEDGKVIVVDSIVSIVPETTATAKGALGSDLVMMTQNPGGKERTRQEFIELAEGSGFSGVTFICCVCGYWVMEFYK